MFMVAIIPLMLSPGIGGGTLRSIRLAVGASLTEDSLGLPLWPAVGDIWDVGALPLAVVLAGEADELALVWVTTPALFGFFLLLLGLWPLLG